MRKGLKKALSLVLSAAMMMSLGSGVTFNTASAKNSKNTTKTEAADAATPSAVTTTATVAKPRAFKAMVGFQTSKYDCRDGYNTKNKQAAVDALYNAWAKDNGKEVTDKYHGYNIYLNGNVPSVNNKTNELKKPENVEVCTGASVTDVKMKKDGEYTVAIKNLDLRKKADVKNFFNELFVSTDIPILKENDPNANTSVKASSVKIDGKEYADALTVLPLKADARIQMGTYNFMFANGYAPDDGTTGCKYQKANPVKKAEDGKDCGAATDLVVPNQAFDIEITFQISGVDWSTAPEVSEDDDDVAPTLPPVTPGPTAPPVESIAPIAAVDLKTPFDMFISANVNDALTPDKGDDVRKGSDGKAIQSATFGSEATKAKVLAAKDAKGNTLFDTVGADYFVSDSSSAYITKTGVYELSVKARGNADDFAQTGAVWMPVLINGTTGTMPTDFNIKGNSITVNGASGTNTYSWNAQMMQDSQGNVRLSAFNQWASENEKAAANTISQTIPVKKGDTITFKFAVVSGAPAPVATATPEAISASTSYKSYLGFQTDDWLYRDPWNNSDSGLKSKEYNYLKQVAWNHGGKTIAKNVQITDATMTKNDVKYNVSIKGLNVKSISKKSTKFNMLFLSTEIPLSMKGVTVKNAVLKIDGKVIKKYKVVPNKADASKYYQFMLADAYAPADGTKNAPYPSGKELKTLPKKSIEVEYVISGVDFNSRTVSVGNFKYKLTKKTAQVVGLSKQGKKKANLSLGKTVKVKAASPSAVASAPAVQTYKITSVKAGAFKGASKLKKFSFKKATNIKKLPSKVFMNCKKLKTVELNKNMKSIPAKAFAGCKKLTTIKCNAKLKSVSKSAFKNGSKKVKVTGKSKKANKKKIKKVLPKAKKKAKKSSKKKK